jgi:hypothetical protein
MTKNLRVLPTGILTLMTLIAACHRSSPDSAAPSASPAAALAKPKTESAEKQTLGMVHAASPAKERNGGLELKFQLAERPVAGRPVRVMLALFAHFPTKNVELRLTPGEGLSMASAAANSSVEELAAEVVFRSAVDVTAAQPGIVFLNAVTSFDNSDSAQNGEFSIPIIVGSARGADDPKH